MDKQNELNGFLNQSQINRRDLLKWASVLGLASTTELISMIANQVAPVGAAGSAFSPVRPPATPLVVRGPYVNVWQAADNLTDRWPTFWEGSVKAIGGIARIDNVAYTFLGTPSVPGLTQIMTQTNLKVTPTKSIYTLQAGGITLTLTFFSPVEANDYQRLSIPLSYIFAQVQSNDGGSHNVSLYFDISGEWANSDTGQQVNWSRTQVGHNGGSLTSMSFSLVSPNVLHENSDFATWGYPVWATANVNGLTTQIGSDVVVRGRAVNNGSLDGSIAGGPRAINDGWTVLGFNFALGSVGTQATTPIQLVLGHVRTPAVSYLGQNLNSLWLNYWSNSDQMLAFFYDDSAGAQQRANQLDNRITLDATLAGGPNYAALLALATRQAFGAVELVQGPNNTPWLALKEISTSGGFCTVDVIYPCFPILLYLNANLVRPLCEPIIYYCESGHWPQPFCVHDLGAYPNAFGHNDGGGENMQVEETANMLIMAASYIRYGNQGDVAGYAQQHYNLFHQWANYLNAGNGGNPNRPNALDPLLQNQTDDFTGLIAHSTNLALKGIIGLGAMSVIANAAGNGGDTQFFSGIANNLIGQWAQLGQDPSGTHLTIAYIEPDTNNGTGAGTYSLKYNSYPDKILGLHLLPASVALEESAYYQSKENQYGIPLDSRNTWIKVDWALWTATGIGDSALTQFIVNTTYNYVNSTPDRAPFTDLYYTNTGRQTFGGGFIARPVIGGIFSLVNLLQTGSNPVTYHKIVNQNSGKVLAVNGASTADRAQLTQWPDNGTTDHNWKLVGSGGYYKIINQNSGKLVAVSNMSLVDGGLVIQWSDNGTPDHNWALVDIGNGYFHIVNQNSGKLLAIVNASTADGANVQQWSDNGTLDHNWKLIGIVPTGVNYKIINQNSGKLLAVNIASTAAGANVQQYHDNGTSDHLWHFTDAGGGYYTVTNQNSGKVLDVSGASTANGAQVVQWTNANGSNQHWQLVYGGGGFYKLVNQNSGQLLAVNGASTADSANVTQWPDNGTPDHLWKIVLA